MISESDREAIEHAQQQVYDEQEAITRATSESPRDDDAADILAAQAAQEEAAEEKAAEESDTE